MIKKIIALCVALLCFAVFALAAEDVRYAFGVRDASVVNADEAGVVVYCSENRGIASGALNFTYDREAVRFVRLELCAECPVDYVSVYDNEYGQVRVAFASTAGVFKYTGNMFTLFFAPVYGECETAVGIRLQGSELYDDDYSPAAFSAAEGTLTFLETRLSTAEGSGLRVDHARQLITGVITGTDVDTLGSMLVGDFILPDEVHTGAPVESGGIVYSVVVVGDTDRNGRVDTEDYIMARLVLTAGTSDHAVFAAADMDNDGELTAEDCEILREYVLGERLFWPEED